WGEAGDCAWRINQSCLAKGFSSSEFLPGRWKQRHVGVVWRRMNMLSRVANSLYWMSRYMERAENIARIVDVNLQLMLDFQNLDHGRLEEHWKPIVQSTGDEEQFFELFDHADRETVTDFLTFNPENTNSILSS